MSLSLLTRLVAQIDRANDNLEGRVLSEMASTGCIECTAGTVANNRNTGLCAYHEAKDVLAQMAEPLDELADDRHEDEDPIEPLAVQQLLAAMRAAWDLLQDTDCDVRHNSIADVLLAAIDAHGAAAIGEAMRK